MPPYPPRYEIYQSCWYHWRFWLFFTLFLGGGGIFLILTPNSDSAAFWAGVLGLLFTIIAHLFIAKKWKKSLLCTLSDEGLETASPQQFYPWEQLNELTIVSGTFCLRFGEGSTNISGVLVKEKKKELMKIIAYYYYQIKKLRQEQTD